MKPSQECQDHLRFNESLKESEMRFRKVFEDGPLGMVMVDKKFFFTRVNSAFCRLLGYDEKELLCLTFKDITHPDHVSDDVENVTKVFTGELPLYKTEKRYIRKDKAVVWGAATITAVRDDRGGFLYFLTMIEDMTERKTIMEALSKSEETYRLLINNVNAGVFQTTLDGTFLQVNHETVSIAGFDSADELMRQHLSQAYANPGDRVIFIDRLKSRGEVRDMEIQVKKKNSGPSWISMNAVLQKNKDGKPESILGVIYDITGRKNAENELRNSRDVLELIFRTSPDAGIITRLSDGMIVQVNDRFVTISGYGRDEAVGKTSLNLRLYEDPESRRMVVEMLHATGHCDNAEIVFRTKSGATFSGLMSAQIINIFGAPHVYSIIRDLTERIKTEQMLQNAQKLESLGVLAGGIAHDFNNLLTGVFGNVDLACTVCPDPRTTEYLKSTLTALHRAKALTLQLLTFAKGGEPVLKITAIAPLIQESAQFALSGSNISCVYHFGDGLWLCTIDKNQIGQVVDNIIINAMQAMPNGGSIGISAVNVSFGKQGHPQLAQGAYVKVSIKDHGIGIPADIMPRIFDPFYTTKIKGHGLGLATSYSIIKRHNGCIEVESQPGKGSTFHMYLPATTKAAATEITTSPARTGSGTVIVVDDEEVVVEVCKRMLQSLGYTASCFSDGKDAIDFYRNELKANRRYAAMLCDLTIPGGMGGIDVVKVLRTFDTGLPVVVVSGYADDPVMQNPKKYGFTDSLSKPFTMTELSGVLGKHVTT